ncbi:hypothetical protein Tco_0162524 [Tanacetum coccineum]
MLNHSKAEPMGLLKDLLCQVGVTTVIAKFLILNMHVDKEVPILVGRGFLYTCGSILDTIERTTSTFDVICHQKFRAAKTNVNNEESDSDDDEDYCIKRNILGAPIYGPKSSKYLNCSDLMDQALALQETIGTYDDEVGSSRPKRFRQYETVGEAILPHVHHQFLLWEGCNRAAKTRYNTKLAHFIENMLEIKVYEAGSQEEIFSSEAWRRVFDINDLIYTELCHEFYSTYKFDEVCADNELRRKKVIKFQLCGRAHSLTLLEFARRLGLYHSDEVNEEGFDVYFLGGLRSDENFNARDY